MITPTVPAARRFALALVIVLACGAVAVPPPALSRGAVPDPSRPPKLPFIYGGDSDFPPYEYLDELGQPRGFNVDLIRALFRELAVPIEVHLRPWPETLARFDGGEVDLISLAYSDRRAARYQLLWQTWTLHQSLVYPSGRRSLPQGLTGLAREVVAVEAHSLMAELLASLPERERPAIVPKPSQIDALIDLTSGRASVAAGNDLTLRHAAAALGLQDLTVVPVKSVSYHLATVPNPRIDTLPVVTGLRRLAQQGEIDRLVEAHLTRPSRQDSWRDHGQPLALAGGLMLLVVGAFVLWNQQLRAQVASRTAELERSLLEVRRSGRGRERALDALRASESRYRSLIQNMLGGLIVVNDKRRIVLTNPALERLFGYDPGELAGKSVELLAPADSPEAARALLRSAFGQALGRITEWEGRRKNGGVFPFELSMFEFDGPNGRLYAGHLVDISDRREVSRMKDEFVSVVSHELRTPLTSMRASMQLLLADCGSMDPQESRELLTVALNNTERLVRIINDILDVAKIEAGHLGLKRRASQPQELVRQAVLTVEQLARSSEVPLAVSVAPGLPPLLVDPDRIVQALVNLLSNALKFAPAGTSVTVGAEVRIKGAIRFWVHDCGKGIASDQLARLFQKFQQLDGPDPRGVPGTGLGLAITKALIEQHGGRVGVASAPGEGTTFYFTLPLDSAEAGIVDSAA